MDTNHTPALRQELLDDFYAECDESIHALRTGITEMERGGTDAAGLQELFRGMHSLKGNCAIVGLVPAETLAHRAEDLLRVLTKQETEVSAATLDILMVVTERLNKLVAAHRQHTPLPAIDDLLPRIAQLAVGDEPGTARVIPVADTKPEITGERWQAVFAPTPALDQHGVNINTIRESFGQLGQIIEAKPSVAPGKGLVFTFQLALREAPADLAAWQEKNVTFTRVEQTAPATTTDNTALSLTPSHFVRVELGQLDELMRITGEIIIHRSRLEDRLGHREAINDDLKEIDIALARSLRELRAAVSRVRLVPVAEIFSRMPYVVRDLARDSEKEVQVGLEGEQTEIDKYLVERLKEPLLHLVRNAFSHALETPAERRAAGKPAQGTIWLRARRSGDAVEIQIADDGRGIDGAAVAARAKGLGLTVPPVMDANGILHVICQPGFSTREAADRAAGRGVGMAVVWNTIRELNGHLRLDTTPGVGTTFTLRLPLTLSIADALIVTVGDEICALPQAQVAEIIQIESAEVRTIRQSEVVPYRGGLLPFIRLRKMFSLSGEAAGLMTIVVVNSERGSTGLVVDRVQGKREIVIRPLTDPLVRVGGIAGATELGNGRPVLILDAAAITAGVVRPARTRTLGGNSFMSMDDTYIIFELAGAAFAVRSSDVQHVEMLEHITPVPNTAPAVDGVVFSRGQVFPALNLRVRFGLPRQERTTSSRLIFLKIEQRVVALIVDTAREFQRIPAATIRPVEETLVGVSGNYVEGVTTVKGRSVLILDVGAVLTLEETTLPAGAENLSASPAR